MAGFGSAALGSIGMSVPGTESYAGAGQNGGNPVESDEERRRRLALQQQQRSNPSTAGLTALSSVGGGAGRYGGSLLAGFGL